jgi:ABC-2 type transport system permease protein
MKFSHVWTITAKDMGLIVKKKYVLYTMLLIPLVLAIGLPSVIWFVKNKRSVDVHVLLPIIDAFSFLYIILGALIPATFASYSFVGEKVEKTLEPLLATPTTDSEILLGKFLAAVIPSIGALYISSTIFMILMNVVISGALGSPYYPNSFMRLILLLCVPLAIIFSVELCVIISSRLNDIRAAQQLSSLPLIPFMATYILLELSVFTFENETFLIIAGIFIVIDGILFFFSRMLFQREEILTKWK